MDAIVTQPVLSKAFLLRCKFAITDAHKNDVSVVALIMKDEQGRRWWVNLPYHDEMIVNGPIEIENPGTAREPEVDG